MLRAVVLFVALASSACSIRRFALESVADALSGQGSSFSSDDDPELVLDAVPFALKTMESLIAELPNHAPLHLAACRGFVQYSYAFVLAEASQAEVALSRALSARARRLFLRARQYCLRGLDIAHPGWAERIVNEGTKLGKTAAILAELERDDVPCLYWLAAGWTLAITSNKEQIDLFKDFPVVEGLIGRAVALDPDWDAGTLQELLISFESRSEAMGGSVQRARAAFERAVALSRGKRAGPYVSLAENVSVPAQDKKEFVGLLEAALAIDVDGEPGYRLANVIAQRRARWLLAHVDDLILGDEP